MGEDHVRIVTGSVEDEGCVREGGVRGIGGGERADKKLLRFNQDRYQHVLDLTWMHVGAGIQNRLSTLILVET